MTSSKTLFKSWWALEPGEKLELLGILVLASAAEVAVKLVRLPRLTSLLGIDLAGKGERNGEPGATPRMSPDVVERKARMVDRVYRHWPRKRSCLRRALVLGYRVRKARPTLLIGVAREGPDVRAHAWIEIAGEVVGDQSGDWAPLRPHESHG